MFRKLFGSKSKSTSDQEIELIRSAGIEGNLARVRSLLAKGTNVNVKVTDGITALMAGSVNGRLEIVGELLSEGADVNIKDIEEGTALTLASLNGHKEIVQILKNA